MQIRSINNFYPINIFKNKPSVETDNSKIRYLKPLNADVVSFSAKKYDIESILNPTNHCAYCGCKVYNDAQIESLARSMLNSKSSRLQGDVKSVLEKFESAVHSDELTFAKKVENREEIDFFKKLLEIANNKSYLKGDAIFEQVYHLNADEAVKLLINNMLPLLRTVDHVSPQNLDEENNNADVNLVEACYCCNHDLKKGVSFAEFYAMFPSIKENMPPDKFEYAHSKLLASSASSILNRMSAANLLKHIQRLFGLRDETVNRLSSIDFRLNEANASVDSGIQSCLSEISEKQAESIELQSKLDSISSDPEYKALKLRAQKLLENKQLEAQLQSLRDRRRNLSVSLNEIRTPSKKQQKKNKPEMTPEEKEAKVQSLKEQIFTLTSEIEKQEAKMDDIKLEIMELDSKFPTIDMLQISKNKADSLCNVHIQLSQSQTTLQELQQKMASIEESIAALEAEISEYSNSEFNPSLYPPEEQQQYARYTALSEALKYLDEHNNNGGGTKSIINDAAKIEIEREIAPLLQTGIVTDFNSWLKRKELLTQLEKKEKQKAEIKNKINALTQSISSFKRTLKEHTFEEDQAQSQKLAADIRRLNEKQNYLKLPSVIASLKAEVILLQSTVNDLRAKKSEIGTVIH